MFFEIVLRNSTSLTRPSFVKSRPRRTNSNLHTLILWADNFTLRVVRPRKNILSADVTELTAALFVRLVATIIKTITDWLVFNTLTVVARKLWRAAWRKRWKWRHTLGTHNNLLMTSGIRTAVGRFVFRPGTVWVVVTIPRLRNASAVGSALELTHTTRIAWTWAK